MNGLKITAVAPQSTAAELGLSAGDFLVRIGNRPVRDIIDYHFLLATERPVLTVRRGQSEFSIPLGDDAGLTGLEFAEPFGRIRRCANRCVFCFVDQQPSGLRPSLCFKDDDYRLSFWEGNFITLTNVTEADLKRIIRQRLSPLYISVHTTNPELRAKMLRNPQAAEINEKLRKLAAEGIGLHAQVVLCPGLNDREELARTVTDLAALYPAVRSVAVVPVGLTRHREGLYPLRPVTPAEAAQVLGSVAGWQDRYRRRFGSRIVFASDEFYLLAGKNVPAAKEYEGFPQLENGVGLVRRFLDAWNRIAKRLPAAAEPRRAIAVTGEQFRTVLAPVVARLNEIDGLEVALAAAGNRFFGPTVSVAGLLTGQDIREAVRKLPRPDLVLVPAAALKDRRVFLDDMSCDELAKAVGCPVVPAGDPREMVTALGLKLVR
ncbi:MAG: DUF512 domain-containing protein [Bacillota bacterium]